MPTRATFSRPCSIYCEDSGSWTEDLPVCKESGIGLSTNLLYREDGNRQEEHEFQDQSFHFKIDDSISMYGVFDGHDGVRLAKYAMDIITAEVLLGQLEDKTTDDDVKKVLREAFNAVETNYLKDIGDKIAEKTSLQLQIPDNLTPYEVYQQNPVIVDKLNTINTNLSCGTTAVIALIYLERLYIANVGDSRALLCKTDSNGVLRVVQLTQDHILSNEDEILRLSNLKIPIRNIRKGFRLGNHVTTRCLGNYLLKAGYKEFEELSSAVSEPVIAVPEITGGIAVDGSCRFLMLMSSGLYRSLEEATGTQNVNQEITQLVVEQFRIQSNLTGVAQAVVDKVVRIHHDFYMNRTGSDLVRISKREDITLLIRNFNFPLPNAISPVSCTAVNFPKLNPAFNLGEESTCSSNSEFDSSVTINSEDVTSDSLQHGDIKKVVLASGPIKPYVDFTYYYENVEKRKREGTLPARIDFF